MEERAGSDEGNLTKEFGKGRQGRSQINKGGEERFISYGQRGKSAAEPDPSSCFIQRSTTDLHLRLLGFLSKTSSTIGAIWGVCLAELQRPGFLVQHGKLSPPPRMGEESWSTKLPCFVSLRLKDHNQGIASSD